MTKAIRRFGNMVTDRLLPHTEASAGCAPDCVTYYDSTGTLPLRRCCFNAKCEWKCTRLN
ncbi:hypothetical protein [Streptomyces sp. CC219B]|uniref:hypothetical protein n=1 Tax=Streptomyces sp. CC219B TaxID=3044574 RepID=UPI0024A85B80|nr:hypothetical protein [Streptomyces sp. CC219B]